MYDIVSEELLSYLDILEDAQNGALDAHGRPFPKLEAIDVIKNVRSWVKDLRTRADEEDTQEKV